MLSKIKKNYFLLITTFFFLYFIFNLLDGERGLLSYLKKKQSLINLQNEELLLSNKIKNLESKNSLLTDNVDLDFIEILLRKKFLLGKKNEKLYIIEKHDN